EQNYFAWGSELLYHRAVWQARDVFQEGAKAWPRSARMITALGAALFAGALYDDAAERLCQAATLEPDNAEPYLFMGRIEMAAPHPLPCVEQKLAEFHRRNPGNALADYYYAMSLSKQPPANASADQQITALLQQAVASDPRCGEAWLQLGNLQAQSGHYASAIPLYAKAADAKPQMSEAWYRLGLAYDRTGQRDKAQEAFAEHDRIEKEQAAAVEAQRRAIKQFVISSAGSPAPSPNH
ncbi:MAG TPA: tetratricopeptide repeat protein, partial [Acidobacteriaceae bacterium]|nr:tetratricopeptide repeat protein [Acidobacteriaceae bacterium]